MEQDMKQNKLYMVKQLKQETNAGLKDCVDAYNLSGEDLERAKAILESWGEKGKIEKKDGVKKGTVEDILQDIEDLYQKVREFDPERDITKLEKEIDKLEEEIAQKRQQIAIIEQIANMREASNQRGQDPDMRQWILERIQKVII
jgi:translation elongation factor EF-Ts